MADYKKFARPGTARPRPFGNNNRSQDRETFDAECNSCHQRCQVPFRPNGKKPVYCANCFVRDENPRASTGNSYGPRKEFSPRPTTRPAFNAEVPDRQIQDLKKQIEVMNQTLERLITAVDTFNRATALTQEIRKHFPTSEAAETEKPKTAAVKKAVAKKAPAKAPAKKAAKK